MELETDFNYKIRIIEKYLVEPLKNSVYKKYYSFIWDEITFTSKVLILDEGEGLYSIEFNPYEIKINFGTEFFELYCQKIRFKTPEPERKGFIIFNENIDKKTPEELLTRILQILMILGGAERIWHTNTTLLTRDYLGILFNGMEYYANVYNYDVYIEKEDCEPYVKTIDNVTFHVNCDWDENRKDYIRVFR